MVTAPRPPKKFLKILHVEDDEQVGLTACAGFEFKKWRARKLAEHLVNWLPHFALRRQEIESIGAENPWLLLRDAATRVFQSSSGKSRGEIGELLLHIISVTEYKAHAFVSRLFYKMRSNDQVTGFDSALVTYDENTEEIELWLGEAKFYSDTKGAVSAALASLKTHLKEGFLKETKILVGPKIEADTPGYAKLQWLFDDASTLDEIIDRIVVPVLIASESEAAQNFDGNVETYRELVLEEYEYVSGRLASSPIAAQVRVVAIYIPLASKAALETEFINLIKGFEE